MEFRCPQCGKKILSQAREDCLELVVRVRFLKLERKKHTVRGRCRHCGKIIELPFIKAAI
ncbi:MAG: hypothetical protein JRJ66_12595 [Deltaproteobacteria bacterium]|nr:hypothetical protein [Deltaproteobacteria bacterium]